MILDAKIKTRTIAMNKRKPPTSAAKRRVQGVQIGYFELCQEIGGTLQEAGRDISKQGIYGPVFYEKMQSTLRMVRAFCARAATAIEVAQGEWDAAVDLREKERLAEMGLTQRD